MVRIILLICALAALSQCSPRKYKDESMDDLINGLAKERNDFVLEGGTGIAIDNDRTNEIVSRGESVITPLCRALLNPSGKIAGYSAFCLRKLKANGAKTLAISALRHWQSQGASFDTYFAASEISKLIESLK